MVLNKLSFCFKTTIQIQSIQKQCKTKQECSKIRLNSYSKLEKNKAGVQNENEHVRIRNCAFVF